VRSRWSTLGSFVCGGEVGALLAKECASGSSFSRGSFWCFARFFFFFRLFSLSEWLPPRCSPSLLCATRPPPVSNHSRTNTLGIHARAMSEAKPTPATTGAAPANAASGSSEHVNLKVIDQVGARVNVERHERMSGGERQGYPLSVFACLSFVCVCVCVCVVVVVGFALFVCAHYCVARKRSALPHSPDHTASQAHELLL
jgi:hypothetical protein